MMLSLGTLVVGGLLLSGAPPATVNRDSTAIRLYTDLGDHHVAISTRFPMAQKYFDQGMRLVYGFNHGEAIRAFDEAARIDPDCAICHWGAALAYGPHVNAPMDSAAGLSAFAQLQEAISLAPHASRRERALITALAARYAAVPRTDRRTLDAAYAQAMAAVVKQYPRDLDVATLYAEALMNVRPWDYWTRDGKPQPGTRTILSQLERVLRANPNHPGACHYYIHAVEAVDPKRALPCADRLAALMPGGGHMVHMPGHIYIRLGRYAEAIDANVHALHADESYIAAEHPSGLYPVAYYPHNYHFLAFAAMLAGRSRTAIDAARTLGEKIEPDVAHEVSALQSLVAYYPLALMTFGRWDDVLSAPRPRADLRIATALVNYARGVAYARKNQFSDAGAMLDSIRAIASATSPEDRVVMTAGTGENKILMEIAAAALSGEIAQGRGDLDDAIVQFREAARLEGGFSYTEPPQWHFPIRHSLGDVLLRAGRLAESETAYREDLRRFPENGWSLYGLSKVLRARGNVRAADAVDARFRKAWSTSDVRLTASTF